MANYTTNILSVTNLIILSIVLLCQLALHVAKTIWYGLSLSMDFTASITLSARSNIDAGTGEANDTDGYDVHQIWEYRTGRMLLQRKTNY